MNKINDFRGEYRWLSNFAIGDVFVFGYQFQNREAAFQAMKCESSLEAQKFCNLGPSEAKTMGRTIKLRKDWESIKDEVMYRVCQAFFIQHEEDRKKLLATEDAYLEEGNTWNDTYWGVCNGVGKNTLGKILMRIRKEMGGK